MAMIESERSTDGPHTAVFRPTVSEQNCVQALKTMKFAELSEKRLNTAVFGPAVSEHGRVQARGAAVFRGVGPR